MGHDQPEDLDREQLGEELFELQRKLEEIAQLADEKQRQANERAQHFEAQAQQLKRRADLAEAQLGNTQRALAISQQLFQKMHTWIMRLETKVQQATPEGQTVQIKHLNRDM